MSNTKKAFTLILAIISLLFVFAFSASATLKGDVNIDGVTNAADARLALRAAVGLENLNSQRKDYADVNFDGEITSADARLILRAAVGLEEIVCVHKMDMLDFDSKLATPKENGYIYYDCAYCDYNYTEETVFNPVYEDSILIPSINLHNDVAVVENLTQTAVNHNDIVANYEWGKNDPIICGHVHYVLQNLHKVKVGDTIYFTRDGITEEYVVTRSEEGYLDFNGTNIRGYESGKLAMYNSDSPTLHLYTCHGMFNSTRWIVIAEKV